MDELKPGPKGFQNEPGFAVVDHDDYPEGYAVIMVPVIYCKSDEHPVPQPRYASPHEVARGVLEVADRLYAVRVHGVPIIGRRDDIAEIGKSELKSHALKIIGRKLGELFLRVWRLPAILKAALGVGSHE